MNDYIPGNPVSISRKNSVNAANVAGPKFAKSNSAFPCGFAMLCGSNSDTMLTKLGNHSTGNPLIRSYSRCNSFFLSREDGASETGKACSDGEATLHARVS